MVLVAPLTTKQLLPKVTAFFMSFPVVLYIARVRLQQNENSNDKM